MAGATSGKWHPPPAERRAWREAKPWCRLRTPRRDGPSRSADQRQPDRNVTLRLGMSLPDVRESHTRLNCHKSHTWRHNPYGAWDRSTNSVATGKFVCMTGGFWAHISLAVQASQTSSHQWSAGSSIQPAAHQRPCLDVRWTTGSARSLAERTLEGALNVRS